MAIIVVLYVALFTLILKHVAYGCNLQVAKFMSPRQMPKAAPYTFTGIKGSIVPSGFPQFGA